MLLKPGAVFPPNEEQLAAIGVVKELLVEDHLLAMPDEATALEVAGPWVEGEPPAGRPYEMGAGTSGYAFGAVIGQCSENNLEFRIILYFSPGSAPQPGLPHLSP